MLILNDIWVLNLKSVTLNLVWPIQSNKLLIYLYKNKVVFIKLYVQKIINITNQNVDLLVSFV